MDETEMGETEMGETEWMRQKREGTRPKWAKPKPNQFVTEPIIVASDRRYPPYRPAGGDALRCRN